MYEKFGAAHSLNGFPGAVVVFQRALDSNRHRIAKEAGVTASELRALSRVAEAGSITPKVDGHAQWHRFSETWEPTNEWDPR